MKQSYVVLEKKRGEKGICYWQKVRFLFSINITFSMQKHAFLDEIERKSKDENIEGDFLWSDRKGTKAYR